MRHPAAKLNAEGAPLRATRIIHMLIHMIRTTLLIDDALYAELKRRAAAERRTLTDVVERTLRAGLRGSRGRAARRAIPSYDLGPFLEEPVRDPAAGGGR